VGVRAAQVYMAKASVLYTKMGSLSRFRWAALTPTPALPTRGRGKLGSCHLLVLGGKAECFVDSGLFEFCACWGR